MDIVLNLGHSEHDFIAACVRKEKWAQKRLYEDHYSPMMGVCLRYSGDQEEALDILHEGFIKVFRNIAKYNAGTSLSAWIRRIMINTAIDYYRKKARRRTDDLYHAYNIRASGPDAVSMCGEKEILESIQQLSPAYRTVFNMYVIEGFSHREIADRLNISESTSRSNLVKARVKLQALIHKLSGVHG
ncbi:MAG: sigma-70 family RNA polymerase sigma factor [Saprospiraceae bacterium]|nr:sigma-70 family RNA polymerase sigma factor [Saprospiraceae bacterium]